MKITGKSKPATHYLKILSTILYLSLIASLLFFSNCSKNSTEPEKFNYPDSGLSFSRDIHPIFLTDCVAGGNCHQSGDPAGGLDLQTDFPTFQSPNRTVPDVIPLQPYNSILYLVLLGPYNGIPRMPLDRAPLADAQIKAIKTWIEEGAITTN